MLFNNTMSACSGIIPVVGDIIVAVYKANSRNAMLLEEFLRIRGEEYLRLQAESEDEVRNGRTIASGVSQRDMEQIKPGAGMTEPGRSFSSLLSRRANKQPMQLNSDRGRFIEHMNN